MPASETVVESLHESAWHGMTRCHMQLGEPAGFGG